MLLLASIILFTLSNQQTFEEKLEAVNAKYRSPFKPSEIAKNYITRERMNEILVGFVNALPEKVLQKDTEEYRKTINMANSYCKNILKEINSLEVIVNKMFTGALFSELIAQKQINSMESYNQEEISIAKEIALNHKA